MRARLVDVGLFVILPAVGHGLYAEEVIPLRQAHAHNDYHHPRPLHDALACGFTSVEADIFLVDGELLVGHDRSELRPDRTLRSLYLDPLQVRIREHDGHVYQTDEQFKLLIDIKSRGAETYEVLDRVLSEYADMFTRVESSQVTRGPVLAVVSGNRARHVIDADLTRFVGVDGRLSDLGSEDSPDLLPWISDRWGAHFQWDGTGEMPGEERQKLAQIVSQAHREGRAVRFWATPETREMWRVLAETEVDRINTDHLSGLRDFLLNRE